MLNGTPNEFTTFNGVPVPVKDQFLWYEFWGSDRTFPHFAAPWAWAMDTPFKWMKQVASHLRRDGPGRGHVVARPHQRRGRHPPPVSPPHRHRSDHPRSDRHPGAGYAQRHQAAPHGRREHGLHVGQGERQRPVPAHHAILRDARQPRHLPRRLGGVHDPGDAPVGTEQRPAARRDHRVQVGALQRRGGSHRVQRPGGQNAGQAQADAGHLLRRGEEA